VSSLSTLPGWWPAAAAIGGGVVVVGAGVWLWRRWHRPTAEEQERQRRLHVHAVGRLAGGEIVEMVAAPAEAGAQAPPTVVYQYSAHGVTYQASQALHLVPAALDPGSWIPGWPVQVKYDPAQPGNSIVACEHWNGLGGQRSARAAAASRGAKPLQ
jgi:hypothetical protein